LGKTDNACLRIEWSDGVAHEIRFFHLRKACPCATCTEKHGPRPEPAPGSLPILTPAQARPLDITNMRPAGNYGYHIQFSDGHNSGVFTLDLLRLLGEETARREQSQTP
jgi:DUF971 family protein